jgi:glycosyltransferase involved in cell wall biosynthesis
VSTSSGPITAVTISGHRQAAVTDSPDFQSWSALAERLGEAACYWAGPSFDKTYSSGLHVHRSPRRPGISSVTWVVRAVWWSVGRIREARRRGRLVVVNGGEPWGWFAATVASRLTGRPFLMDVHGDYFNLPAASVGRRRKWLLRAAVTVFARLAAERRVVAVPTAQEMSRRGLSSTLVPPRLLPVWDEPPHRLAAPFSNHHVSLLVVGRLISSKGYDLLIQALSEVRTAVPDIHLTVVGDGPLRAELEAQVTQFGLEQHVAFLGAGDVVAVRNEMSRADLFVISSRDEGLPRTLLEAVAAGLPVVATSVGGIPAAVADWPTVRLVAPAAPAIAEGIRLTIASPPAPHLVESAREVVLTAYGFGTNLDALADCYHSLVRA